MRIIETKLAVDCLDQVCEFHTQRGVSVRVRHGVQAMISCFDGTLRTKTALIGSEVQNHHKAMLNIPLATPLSRPPPSHTLH